VGLSEVWNEPLRDHSPHFYGFASDGERVFALRKNMDDLGSNTVPDAAESDAELFAYDGATGKPLWHTTLPWIENAVPVAGEGIVVIPSGQQDVDDPDFTGVPAEYVAFDSVTGAERWRKQVTRRAEYPLTEYGAGNEPGAFLDGVFYYADGGSVFGVDPTTGEVRHEVTSTKNVVFAGPVVAGGRIAVLAGPPFDPDADEDAGDPYTRSAYMFAPDLQSQVGADFPRYATPNTLAASGEVLVSSDGGIMWATDARNGNGLWSIELPDLSGPVGVLGKVVVVLDAQDNLQHKAIGYDLLTGKQVWTAAPPNDGPLESDSLNVGIADGTVFGLTHGISIIDGATGEIVSRHSTNRGGGLVVEAAGHIVIYNQDGITGFE
ncbi:MAG: PQQ-binding-like beta-propeller repeat protein, partial [Actinomycetes bacterium]